MAREVCETCKRPQKVCFCPLIKPVNNHWPVQIVQHIEETRHAIGTARIAQLSLQNSHTHVLKDDELFVALDEKEQAVLVYPGKGSLSLEELRIGELKTKKPQTLIFIDASWRKSKKIFYQSEYLQSLSTISFSFPYESRYRIRKEPKPGYCSTLEAIVYMLGELEEESEKYATMLKTMDWMIDRQIDFMGGKPGNKTSNY